MSEELTGRTTGFADPAHALPSLRVSLAEFRGVLAEADLDAAVPACPGWDLRQLAWHLGELHRWVRGAILEGHPDTRTPPGPRERAELLAWFDEGAGALVRTLTDTAPDTPCWVFGPGPRTVRFWLRRQVHEHAVHGWDAQSAVGVPAPIEAGLALDGVEEVVLVFFPRQVRLGRIAPLNHSLGLRPTDAGAGAFVLTATQGLALQAPDQSADAEVSGPAEALYLLLWRRIGLDDPRLVISGDLAAARDVLGRAIVP